MFGINEKAFAKYIMESESKLQQIERVKTNLTPEQVVRKVALNFYLREFLSNTKIILEGCTKEQARDVLIFARKMWQRVDRLNEEYKAQDVQHDSTALNVLEQILTKIIPIIEKDYKTLTTDPAQRKSFRAHIVNGIQNLIAGQNLSLASAGAESKGFTDRLMESFLVEQEAMESLPPIEGDGQPIQDESATTEQDKDKFIDVFNLRKQAGAGGPREDKEEIERSIFSLEGNDETGRNVAFKCFKKVEPQIEDGYNTLANPKDQEVFSDYLLANIKLYFDKFEEEISSVIPEPTNAEYENASMNGVNAAEPISNDSGSNPEQNDLPPLE